MKNFNTVPDVTIVVTVHNAERYLEKCIQSAIDQTYENIEIICVDGGSTDSSPEILKSIQLKDERIIIINDSNTSYGHKVNVGIEKAKGKYICILESDDCLELDMVEQLYKVAQNNDVDVVTGDYKIAFEFHGKKIGYILNKYSTELYNRVCNFEKERRHFLHGGITGAIYRKSFLRDKKIELNETPGASFQDQSFSFLVDLLATTQYHLNIPVYIYTYDNPSSSMADDKKILEITWECSYIEKQLIEREVKDLYIWEDYYNYKYFTYIEKMKSFSTSGKEIFKKEFAKEIMADEHSKEYSLVELSSAIKSELLKFNQNMDCFDDYMPKERPAKRMAKILDILDSNETVLVGAGKIGNFLMQIANDYGKSFKCVCDNSISLQGADKYGYLIQSVKDAVKKYCNCKYVISVEAFYEEIKAQLISLGISEMNIIKY